MAVDPIADHSVVAVFAHLADAKQAIKQLSHGGVSQDQISLVAHSLEDDHEVQSYLAHGDQSETDAARGAMVGGILGLLAGAAFFWIPGFGPLVILGPLATGFTGSAVGALVGAMTGWGIPKDRVRRYEQKVKAGAVLVIVHGSPLLVSDAYRILTEASPQELHLYAADSADSPEIDDRPLRHT